MSASALVAHHRICLRVVLCHDASPMPLMQFVLPTRLQSCGSELFTGNTAVVTAALYEGKATFKQLIKSWTASYLGNILGCAFGTFLILNSGLTPMLQNGINAISLTKVSYPLSQVRCARLSGSFRSCGCGSFCPSTKGAILVMQVR